MKKNLVVTKSLIGQAEDLAKEHEQFNENFVVAGRLALYGLLQKILKLSEDFDASKDKDDLIKLLRVKLKEQYGIKTQDNTSDTSVLVRFITRAERKAAHVYARAIEAAKASGVTSDRFIGYVQAQGGIERLRALSAEQVEAEDAKDALKQEKLELTFKYLNARSKMPFASFEAPKAFDSIQNKNCGFEIVICVQRGGKYHVLSKLPAEPDLEDYCLARMSDYLCKDIDRARAGVTSVVKHAQDAVQKKLIDSEKPAAMLEGKLATVT